MEKINELIEWIQNIELSQIINIIIAIVLVIFTVILSPLISYIISKIFNWKKSKEKIKEGILYNCLKNLIIVGGIYVATLIIGFSKEIDEFIQKIYRLSIVWIIAKTTADAFTKGKILKSKLKGKENDPVINIINKTIKVFLYIFAGYLSFKEFGFDLGSLLTGLGLSTAIIALAAQDTFRDIFSGLSIFWDKPFAIGDYVEIGTTVKTISGTVEEISFRSTKLRTPEDAIVTIQNSNISTQNIINWSVIKKRVYKTNLKLPLETDEATIEKIINRIKFILKYNKDIIKESTNVYFNTIDADGVNINVYVETKIINYAEYQKLCNKLNLIMLNILETQQVKLAYPGQNIYIKSFEKEDNETKPVKIHSKAVKIEK